MSDNPGGAFPFSANDPLADPHKIQQMKFARGLARDDQARLNAATITLVATTSFTLIQGDDVTAPTTRVINVGDEFQISTYDLPRYAGRGRVKP